MQVRIDNLPVYYEEYGSGDLFVFVLHGWGCEATTYRSIGEALQTRYHVIIPDLPGFGQTPEPPVGWNNEDYAQFVIHFVQSFPCKACDFIGHSFGTRLLIRIATNPDIPFTIGKMVFIDGAGILSSDIHKYMSEYAVFKQKKQHYLKKHMNQELEELRKSAEGDYAYLSEVMCHCYEQTVNDDLTSFLPKITVPTLLIWGEQDKETPPSDGRKMESLIPDSGLVLFPSAGHYSFLDQPYQFQLVLKSFFNLL